MSRALFAQKAIVGHFAGMSVFRGFCPVFITAVLHFGHISSLIGLSCSTGMIRRHNYVFAASAPSHGHKPRRTGSRMITCSPQAAPMMGGAVETAQKNGK